MTDFRPGKIVTEFTSKDGHQAVIRYPRWEDLDALLEYINTLSKEDTFITFSGEEITREEQMEYLTGLFKDIEAGDKVVLSCFVDGLLVGNSDIERDKRGKKRTYHIGNFGISVAKDYRGSGIGYQLAQSVIEEAQKVIDGLKLIRLNVYQPNKPAQKLYEKLGFETAGRIPQGILYEEEYVDDILMYLEL